MAKLLSLTIVNDNTWALAAMPCSWGPYDVLSAAPDLGIFRVLSSAFVDAPGRWVGVVLSVAPIVDGVLG
jgi:hypothetical protein